MRVNGTRVTCKRGTIGTKIKRRKIPFNRLDGVASWYIHVIIIIIIIMGYA